MVKQIIADYDTGSGEILEVRGEYTPKKARKKAHRYYLVYYGNLIKSGQSLSMPMQIIIGEIDQYNKLYIDKELLNKLSLGYGITVGSLKMAVTRMCKYGIMVRLSRGRYFVNPYYFSKTNKIQLEKLRTEYRGYNGEDRT